MSLIYEKNYNLSKPENQQNNILNLTTDDNFNQKLENLPNNLQNLTLVIQFFVKS